MRSRWAVPLMVAEMTLVLLIVADWLFNRDLLRFFLGVVALLAMCVVIVETEMRRRMRDQH